MKTMVLIPCMDTVQTEFCQSLVKMQHVGQVGFSFHSCSLIYKARNDLAEHAIAEDTEYTLWLDSDVMFPSSLLVDMMESIQGRDIVTGVYHMRRPPYAPVIWKTLRKGLTAEENTSELAVEYPKDDIFEVEGCGFGCVLMRTEVMKTIRAKYHDLFTPTPGFGEDLSFCIRARGCGYKIHCDPRIQIGHKGSTIITGETFKSYQAAGGKV